MNKIVKNNQVAVLVSQGYGAGWSTWNALLEKPERLLFDSDIINMIHDGACVTEITNFVQSKYTGKDQVYVGGVDGLTVVWIPKGVRFMVEEVDGYERIITERDLPYTA